MNNLRAIYLLLKVTLERNVQLLFCNKDIHVSGVWTGRYYFLSSDHKRYIIFKNCCPTLDTRE
jgi:hypothetical protein